LVDGEIAGTCPALTSSESSFFGHSSTVRREAVGQIIGRLKGNVREVSAYSTVYPELAQEAACRQSPKRSKGCHLKMA